MSYKAAHVPLADIVRIKGGKRLPAGANLQTEKNSHPYIRVRDMGQIYIPRTGLEYVPDDVFPHIKNYIVEENDVIISIVGTIGSVSIIDKHFHLASQTENCAKLSGLDSEDAVYLYYYLISSFGQQQIKAGTVGAVQPKLPLYNIAKLEIYWPEKNERKRISNYLKSLDNKIELNRQTNQTLEQIAQALFKSWFVDFEPTRAKIAAKEAGASPEEIERAAMCTISGKTPDQLAQLPPETQQNLITTAALFPDALMDSELGEVPEGWEIGTLGDLMSFNPQRTLKKGTFAPYLDMKNIPTEGHLADDVYLREMASGMKFINGDTLLARITPCLENGKTAYVDFLEEDQVGWGSTEFIVMRPKEGRPLSLGYIIARLEVFRLKAIQTMTGSSGRQRADANVLSQQPWINYPIELLEKFDLTSGYFLAIAKNNGEQNKALCELRDTLLPKLLSGEIQGRRAQCIAPYAHGIVKNSVMRG
jgi:type I restriction enzyme S subunit